MSMMRRRLLDNTVRRTAEGEAMAVRSVARMRPGLSIYGKSHQNTVAGNQLFDANQISDGFVNGANVGESFEVSTNPGYPNAQYVKVKTIDINIIAWNLTGCVKTGSWESGIRIRYFDAEGVSVKEGGNAPESGSSETENADSVYVLALYGFTEEAKSKAMLNAGTTALPWEPYTGGQPSPNPDYPQEVVSVGDDGDIGVDVYGGNLFDANYIHNIIDIGGVWGDTRTIVGKNVLEWTSLPDNPGVTRPFYCYPILPNTEYVIAVDNFSSSNPNWYVGIADSNGIGTRDLRIFANIRECSFTTDENEVYLVLNLTNSFECMLNIGSTALPFEPYKQPQSLIVSTPNGFPGIPVSSGGNYTDKNGQQWISDEIDFKRGKYVKRVRILNAREVSWSMVWDTVFPDESGNTHVFNTVVSGRFRGENAFCTHFRFGDFNNPANGYDLFSTAKGGGDIGVRVSSELASTTEEWNQFIQQNDVIFACALQNPIETDLTPEQITAYKPLHTNYPTTTAMNDSDAGMKLTYKTRKSLEVT